MTMSVRLGNILPVRPALNSLGYHVKGCTIRQFTQNARRAKDIASQDNVPNMRHAPRPRMLLKYVLGAGRANIGL